MGTFITSDTTPTIFPDGDKSAAPGVVMRPGWTSDNVLSAAEMNTIKDALLDCRTAIRGDSTPTFDCALSVAVGDFVYVSGANQVATVDITDGGTFPAVGVVTSKPTTTSAVVRMYGVASVFSGLTPGARYWVGASGPIDAPPSPAAGVSNFVQLIGVATATDSLLLIQTGTFEEIVG